MQKEYKKRRNNLGKIVHWKLIRKCNFEAGFLENEDYKILWDFSIRLITLYKLGFDLIVDRI